MQSETQLSAYHQTFLNSLSTKLPEILNEFIPDIPDSQYYLSLNTIRRFAIGFNWDEDLVIKKWKNWVTWRLKYKPHEIREDEAIIQKLLKTQELEWFNLDKENRPVLYRRLKYHNTKNSTQEEWIRYFIFMLEKGIKQAEQLRNEQIVIFIDKKGYANQKEKGIQQYDRDFWQMMDNYYPGRLHCAVMLQSNWIERCMLSLSKRSVESEMNIGKVQSLDKKGLRNLIDKDQLPIEYGGTAKSPGGIPLSETALTRSIPQHIYY